MVIPQRQIYFSGNVLFHSMHYLTSYELTYCLKQPALVMHNTTEETHVVLDSDWEVIYYKEPTKHTISINTLRTTVST